MNRSCRPPRKARRCRRCSGARVSGQVIWAARYRETRTTTTSGGGKTGRPRTTTTRFAYSLSFAVGLCAGEIAGVERAWANGAPFDLSSVTMRLHRGGEDQAPDPLIEAIEGAAPAYRGLAYLVFEDLPLEAFGNAPPQLSFEAVAAPPREPGALESLTRAVCLVPGCGEFVYATTPMQRVLGPGLETSENTHAAQGRSNLDVSLDQLQRDLPNVETVSLVSGWFGDDLRCGACTIRPGVERALKETTPFAWRAGGLDRSNARLLSSWNGGPAFGGTPADRSILEAIAALKARGLKVALNPFLFLDIAPDNAQADPYGAARQAAYPWRGRITCMPAPGVPGSPDKSAAARAQVDAFFGAVAASSFSVTGGAPVCSAPDWKYRQFMLHHAHLAALAGGVDIFVIGSELRGLTQVRDGPSSYPAVAHLRSLVAQVRAVLGPATRIVYAADWSEYGGHRPADGSGDVYFHLDPLWADPDIAAVAIDWYPPLTDWRDGEGHLDGALARSPHDPAYLESRIEAGEYFDWYYADATARAAQTRTPITDGARSKPWVFRAKDLRRFWSEPHFNRPGGVESATPTAWVPQSKPVWIMELGVPAIDKGANAPNLFIDPKSAQSARPPFSNGVRDDLIQRRALEAYHRHWGAAGAPMVDPAHIFLWAWDARPFPQFPARRDVWADGAAWSGGHWLNGRAGAATLADVVSAICTAGGVAAFDTTGLSGVVSGYVVDAPTTVRAAIEPLMAIHSFTCVEREGRLVFQHLDQAAQATITAADLVVAPAVTRYDGASLPAEARLRFIDSGRDYRIATASARQRDALGEGVVFLDAPAVLDDAQATALADAALVEARAATKRVDMVVSPARLDLEPGDLARIDVDAARGLFRILSITDGDARTLELAGVAQRAPLGQASAEVGAPARETAVPRPLLVTLDLPPLPGRADDERPLAAVFASPWAGPVPLYAGADASALTLRGVAEAPAGVGTLLWPLHPGAAGRWDTGNRVRIRMQGVMLAGVSEARLFEGANTFAVAQPDDGWELLQARSIVLVGPDEYELSILLRGQQGTETELVTPAGAVIVHIDDALAPFDLKPHERGADILVTAPPDGIAPSDPRAASRLFHAGDVWARPFAPVHVRGRRLPGGDVLISWIRRARLDGDVWQGEPPGEDGGEGWSVEIRSGGAPVRRFSPGEPRQLYAAADQIADFGSLPAAIAVRIAQVSVRYGPGRGRDSILQL